ncbi:DUF3786 domain-containing protein [Thermodesulfobacteriota bacterium]
MGCASPNSLHWEDLRNHPVDDVLKREGVKTAEEGQGYDVSFLNAVYRVDPVQEQIREIAPNQNRLLTEEFQILLIRYLVAPYGGPLDGKDVSEKDFPGGVTFFQGPHALPGYVIAKRYGSDPDSFEQRSRTLGAVPVEYGDKGMRFYPFPKIPVTLILWKADEEFPASVSVLFDSSIARWFEFDMIFTSVWVLIERIAEE